MDQAFGRYDSDGKYRYHAKTTATYYMPYMMDEVTLDPTTTSPEDEIILQAIQNAVRPSNTFRGVNGVKVTGITETGENAFSFEYEVSGTKYFVNYSWDTNCKFTYTCVDENSETTNLPTNGSIDTDTENTESFYNITFCADVSLGEGGSSTSSNTTYGSDTSGSKVSDDTIVEYFVTSVNSDFTLSSIAIDSNRAILSDYQCEEKINGIEKSIPISWSNVSEGTSSLAITIHAYTNTAVVETNSYLHFGILILK